MPNMYRSFGVPSRLDPPDEVEEDEIEDAEEDPSDDEEPEPEEE